MDFRNVPNTSNYSTQEPVDMNGGIRSTNLSPNAYVAATLNSDDDDKPKHSYKWLLIILIAFFAVLTVGGISFFFYQNSQQAAASITEEYETIVIVPSGATSTIMPTPTYLLPSLEVTPSPDPNKSPTPTPTIIMYTSTPAPTNSRQYAWEISFDKTTYTSRDVNGATNPRFTGTLKSPFAKNATICLADDQIFFTKKQSSSTIERLCDELTPTPSSRTLKCYQYNPDTGLSVSARLYPVNNCASSQTPESGTYVMAVRVYHSCTFSDFKSTATATECPQSREVFSYDLTYTH